MVAIKQNLWHKFTWLKASNQIKCKAAQSTIKSACDLYRRQTENTSEAVNFIEQTHFFHSSEPKKSRWNHLLEAEKFDFPILKFFDSFFFRGKSDNNKRARMNGEGIFKFLCTFCLRCDSTFVWKFTHKTHSQDGNFKMITFYFPGDFTFPLSPANEPRHEKVFFSYEAEGKVRKLRKDFGWLRGLLWLIVWLA